MLGLSLDDFNTLTPRELVAAMNARRKDERQKWEQTRLMMFASMRPHYKDLSISDCLRLPWEEEKKTIPLKLTPEQEARRRENMARWDAEEKVKYLKRNGQV